MQSRTTTAVLLGLAQTLAWASSYYLPAKYLKFNERKAMSAGHSHALQAEGKERSIWWALGLTSAFMIAEVVGGLVTGSLALISDAAHMFTDTAALAIAVAAIRVAKRPADALRTYGYHRFEILAAAFNALLLFGVAIYILFEAYQRFQSPPAIQTGAMIVIAALGLVINLMSMRLLSGGKDDSLNVKGAYLEVWSDMLGSIGVIAGAVLIRYTGWVWVDPLIAVAIGLWVLPRTWVLLKESLNILLEGVPQGVKIPDVMVAMAAVPGVQSVHDLHVWALTSGKAALTAHVVYQPGVESESLLRPLQEMLAKRFQVLHTTLQMEATMCEHTEDGCNFVAHPSASAGDHIHSH
ncbi:cobalt-zinc-cadmium efflux system protein [Paracidovorax konjaci]|uniref:Cobalt-zinc-cadmium efflux system protein n=2 Tax=Paracidovorax konjaci TaxID=32040 RepID=A0A1I1U4N8_9BURK|nr:cobalt-zinc-cadmium efflux system protein [Paracidovorax konjaci]